MFNSKAKYVPKEWNHLIKYDHRKAWKAGKRSFPLDEVVSIGYQVVKQEVLRDYGYTLFEVRNKVLEHPEYIEELAPLWNFDK